MSITNLKLTLADVYINYRNDFLSVAGFASYYGIKQDIAERLLATGRKVVDRTPPVNFKFNKVDLLDFSRWLGDKHLLTMTDVLVLKDGQVIFNSYYSFLLCKQYSNEKGLQPSFNALISNNLNWVD